MAHRIHGLGVCPGLAIAPQLVLHTQPEAVSPQAVSDVKAEIIRFRRAMAAVAEQIQSFLAQAKAEIGQTESEIFEAQFLMLQDPTLTQEVEAEIRTRGLCAQWCFVQSVQARIALLSDSENAYMQQRVLDLQDIQGQMLDHLMPGGAAQVRLDGPVILTAQEITPTQLLRFEKKRLAGVLMEEGGATSHTVLLAAAIGVPCVVGAAEFLAASRSGQTAVVDGNSGLVLLGPSPEEEGEYRLRLAQLTQARAMDEDFRGKPTRTADGAPLTLMCNIASSKEAEDVLPMDGEGVGLFRSEFLYLSAQSAPSEEEQYQTYLQAARALRGRPLTVRTLDAGGDKQIAYLDMPQEANPFMGFRAIRFCLERPDIFKPQLSALLRAAAQADIRIMFPMIATMDEFRRAKAVLREVQEELAAAGVPFRSDIPVGMMVEIPSAAIMADQFIQEADFFSIGTNDLLQYLCSADRGNPRTTYLNDPCDPALLRMIYYTICQAKACGKEVSICGQVAQDAQLIPLWIGMGVDKLSVSPIQILRVRRQIAAVDSALWRGHVQELLRLPDAGAVRTRLMELAAR